MRESEQNFIVQQIDQVNRAILAANGDDVDDWALNNCLYLAGKRELVYALLLDNVPQFHLCAAIE